MRRSARALGMSVELLPKRGKDSHSIWVVLDADGAEMGRIGLKGHYGQQSQTVTRFNEKALQGVFEEGWLVK